MRLVPVGGEIGWPNSVVTGRATSACEPYGELIEQRDSVVAGMPWPSGRTWFPIPAFPTATRPDQNGFAFQLSVLRPNNSCLFFDITRFWVQHWVQQLNEGRMAFSVRKRRQIGHLAFLLL